MGIIFPFREFTKVFVQKRQKKFCKKNFPLAPLNELRLARSAQKNPKVWRLLQNKVFIISQICEQTLKTAVQKGGNLGTVGSGVDWGGFEPPTSAVRGRHSSKLNYQPLLFNRKVAWI